MSRSTPATRAITRRDRPLAPPSTRLLGRLALGGLTIGTAVLAPLAAAAPAFADTASDATPSSTSATDDHGSSPSDQASSAPSAAPQSGATGPTSDVGQDPLTGILGGSLSSIPGSDSPATADDPTPAPTAPQYGAKPETVIDGVPVEGTLTAVQRATSIIPGSGPGDYA